VKRRKLSTPHSRAELIASYAYGTEVKGGDGKPAPGVSDDNEDGTHEQYEPAPYKEESDETVVCPSCEKHNSTDAAFCDQCGFQLKHAEGVKVEDGSPDDETPAKESMAAKAPTTDPVDENGNVDDEHACTNPDCNHLASAHGDTPDGKNRGPCTMQGCKCPAMEVSSEHNETEGEAEDGGEPEIGKEDTAATGDAFAVVSPAEPPADDAPAPDLNAPLAVEPSEAMGPEFSGVLVIEGQPTGDGREIAPEALTWRDPPLPLMGLKTETHDPGGFDMNDPAVIAGRIDTLIREPGEGGTQLIRFKGFFLPNEDGMYFADLTEAMGRLGVSGDVAIQASEVSIEDVDEMGFPTDMSEVMTEGTIMGGTACPFPAFQGAYIVLGGGTEAAEAKAIPQQAEAPEVPDKPPAAVTAGGQLIHWMTYEECEPCSQGMEVIIASGAGPTRPPKSWFENPNFTEGDGRLVEILDRRGKRALGGKFACPLTVEENGRIYGHIAPWGICHTGFDGQCILAPRSAVGYAHFKRGQHIVTAEGEKVRVGVLTADAGHASTKLSASAAMSHYDNNAWAAADVNVGDDEHGIWIAGAVRPNATEEQIRALCAASVSGDWREVGGQLELVAALCVNQPGFPLAVVAAGKRESLVAYGGGVMHRLKHPVQVAQPMGDVALRTALGPLLGEARSRARERIAALTS
jgi:hypothetical protein